MSCRRRGLTFGMLQATETTAAPDGGKTWFIDIIGDKSSLGSEHLLSSVLWNLEPVYTAMIDDLNQGTFGTDPYSIALADDSLQLLKTDHIPADVWEEVMKVRDRIIAGEIEIRPVFNAEEVRDFIQTLGQ